MGTIPYGGGGLGTLHPATYRSLPAPPPPPVVWYGLGLEEV